MAEVQTVYSETIAVGFPGMIATGGHGDRITRTVENSGGIAFGKVAYRGADDHGCTATQTLAAAGAADAGNVGAGAITAEPAVVAPARLGAYKVVQTAGGATGAFAVYDPDGNFVGNGAVGTEFVGGGLTFTVTDPGTDPAIGDSYTVTVSGGEALGITIATSGEALLSGETADKYQRYANVAILCGGEPIWVTAGGAVTDGADVQVDASGDFVASGGTLLVTGGGRWKFDSTAADDGLVKIVKR